jgi:hypothetical protein
VLAVPSRPFDSPYRNQLVRIADHTVVADLIEDLRFENCEIVGPAVLAVLDGNTFNGCGFEGDADAVIWEVEPDRRVIGAVGLRRVEFYGCSFKRIGLAMTPELAAVFRHQLGG